MANSLTHEPRAKESAGTIPNYRQQLKKALPPEVFQSEYGQLLWFIPHLAFIGIGWWLLATKFSWWTAPIVAIVIGHSMGCMGFLGHDITHGGAIKKVWLRDLLGGIAFSAFAISPKLWRRWHNNEHHGNTQVEGIDPDHLFTIEEYQRNPVLQWLYRLSPLARNFVIFGSFTFRMTQQTQRMYITYLRQKETPTSDKLVYSLQMFLEIALWVVPTVLLGSQVVIWGYLIPLLLANAIVISYIATNHFLNPLADDNDVLATSVSVTLPGVFKFLDPWHMYFGAHVAHHLFPQASPVHGRQIDAKTAELWPDRYFEMSIFKALQMLWNTPWVYEDHTTLIDPPRNERHKTLGHGMEDEL